MNTSIRIIKRNTCAKITASANGQLTYEVGYETSDESYQLRITANPGGGFFSIEGVTLENITAILNKHPNTPFKAAVFRPLFKSLGANNHGFLGEAWRSEGTILADDKYVRSSNHKGNIEGFTKAM